MCACQSVCACVMLVFRSVWTRDECLMCMYVMHVCVCYEFDVCFFECAICGVYVLRGWVCVMCAWVIRCDVCVNV